MQKIHVITLELADLAKSYLIMLSGWKMLLNFATVLLFCHFRIQTLNPAMRA
jgi:hypothetical protein